MNTANFCGKCGSRIGEGNRFCETCGAEAGAKAAAPDRPAVASVPPPPTLAETPPPPPPAFTNQPPSPRPSRKSLLAVGLMIGGVLAVVLVVGILVAIGRHKPEQSKSEQSRAADSAPPERETSPVSHLRPSPWGASEQSAEETPTFEPGKPYQIADVEFPLTGKRRIDRQETEDEGVLRLWWQADAPQDVLVWMKVDVPNDPSSPRQMTYDPVLPDEQGSPVTFVFIVGSTTIGLAIPHGRVPAEVAMVRRLPKDAQGKTHYELLSNVIEMTLQFP